MLNKLNNPLERCELKFIEGGVDQVTNGLFEGYASTFGNIDSMGDTVMKGAFEKTIDPENREHPILMLYNHSSFQVIGKWLEMAEDDNGLYVRGEFTPNHSIAADVYSSCKHGAISGMSIGFRIPPDGAEEIEGGGRRIKNVKLEEISIVGFPADDQARIAQVKAMADEISSIDSIRDSEIFLRDAGFSRSMAKRFISQLRPMYQREADQEMQRIEARHADIEWLHKTLSRGIHR